MRDNKNFKRIVIIASALTALALIAVVVYLWSQGVFSGSPASRVRNAAAEEAVAGEADARISRIFSEHGDINLKSLSCSAVIYEDEYPGEIPEKTVSIILNDAWGVVAVEASFAGESLTFEEYKHFTYKVISAFREEGGFTPLSLQIFYYRYPGEGESEDVMQFESRIPNYLFGVDERGVVTANRTHFIVEADDALRTKTKIYYTVRYVYLAVVGLTVIALGTLFIVRRIRKIRRNKKSGEIMRKDGK